MDTHASSFTRSVEVMGRRLYCSVKHNTSRHLQHLSIIHLHVVSVHIHHAVETSSLWAKSRGTSCLGVVTQRLRNGVVMLWKWLNKHNFIAHWQGYSQIHHAIKFLSTAVKASPCHFYWTCNLRGWDWLHAQRRERHLCSCFTSRFWMNRLHFQTSAVFL